MDAKKITELKGLTEQCKHTPSVQGLDARIPAFGESGKDGEYECKKPLESNEPNSSADESSNVESDVGLDNPDVVEPNNDPPQKMVNPSAAVTEKDFEGEKIIKKVVSNAKNIEDHHKEEELRKNELERTRHRYPEAASVLRDGEIITIRSGSELKDKLNAASKTSRLSILYFTATWCGPCRQIAPVFTSLAAKYPKAVFLKIDVDEATDVAFEWHISSIPCFFFVKKGLEVDTFIGVDKDVLEKKIDLHAAAA